MDARMVGRFQLADVQGTDCQPVLLAGMVFSRTGMMQSSKQQDEQLAVSAPSGLYQFNLTFRREPSRPALATWESNVEWWRNACLLSIRRSPSLKVVR